MSNLIDRDKFLMHLADMQLTIAPYTVDCEDAEQRRIAYQTLDDVIDELVKFPTVYAVDVKSLRDALYENDAVTMRGVSILNKFCDSDEEGGQK